MPVTAQDRLTAASTQYVLEMRQDDARPLTVIELIESDLLEIWSALSLVVTSTGDIGRYFATAPRKELDQALREFLTPAVLDTLSRAQGLAEKALGPRSEEFWEGLSATVPYWEPPREHAE